METRAVETGIQDEELALKAASGDRFAYEELVCRYRGRLFHFLRPRLGSDQDVEDLIQETFLKSFRNIASYDPEWRFSTWIYTIASRLAISHYRCRKPQAAPRELPSQDLGPEERVIQSQESRNIWITARRLSRKQYQTLWLRYSEDMNVKEIAEILRLTPVQVRVLLHRGRLRLAALFKQQLSYKKENTHVVHLA